MRSVDVEVAVVGAGAAGLATTDQLACEGRDLAVLEQFRLGHDRGSSDGASWVFRLSYTNTADEQFVLEPDGRVVVGSACSGQGFKLTPMLGAVLARLADEALAVASDG